MSQVVRQELSLVDRVVESLTYGNASSSPVEAASIATYSWSNGTGASAINWAFSKSYTLASAASTTLTLSALVDDLGRTVAFTKIRKLSVYITAKTTTDTLTVGAAASNPWTAWGGGTTPTFTVHNYHLIVAADSAGFAVTASSADQLKFANAGAASMTFTVSISGE